MSSKYEKHQIEYQGVVDTLAAHAIRNGVKPATAYARYCRINKYGNGTLADVCKPPKYTRDKPVRRKVSVIGWPTFNPDTRPYPF